MHVLRGARTYSVRMDTHDYTSHRRLYAHELTRLRTEQGLSKARFAIMVGISRRYLIKLESAKASPTLEMMERIAAGLGVEVRYMVDFERIARLMEGEDASTRNKSMITLEYRG